MSKPKHLDRFNHLFEPNSKGLYFVGASGQFSDLSDINVLCSTVDTVRQLYRGSLKPDVLALFKEKTGYVHFAGYEWSAGKIGRESGYQYKLQNSDLGIIMLIKNFNVKSEVSGPHLKIEVSPHFIDRRSAQQVQVVIDGLAGAVLDDAVYNQAAVHIAVDIQGWQPPKDFVARVHCRSNHVRELNTFDSVDFAELSATYNRGQSYLFGSASGLQMAVYNKSVQAKAIDKLDYWESVWRRHDNPFEDSEKNYNPDIPVWRIEFRYHHSVVQQFADGIIVGGIKGEKLLGIQNFFALWPHIDGLLRYGFQSFRYLYSPKFFHPVWSLLSQDVRVVDSSDSLLEETDYKRHYKTSAGFSGKNIELLLGNFISLAARERLDQSQTVNALKGLPVWETIENFYRDKGYTRNELQQHIGNLLRDRIIRWGRAV